MDGLRARYAAVTAEIEKTRKAQDRLKAAGELRAAGTSMIGIDQDKRISADIILYMIDVVDSAATTRLFNL